MKFLIFAVIAYLFGSLPCGVWIGKIVKNVDIREHGSKNSGATNAHRVLGAKCGIIVLILDALKGYIPLFIASKYDIQGIPLIILGLIAILGHTFSIFLHFKGGKGVATSLGIFLFLMPKVIGVLVVIFIVVVGASQYVSLGSIICAAMLPILELLMYKGEENMKIPLFTLSLIVAIFVIYKHKANIRRIMNGTESKFKIK